MFDSNIRRWPLSSHLVTLPLSSWNNHSDPWIILSTYILLLSLLTLLSHQLINLGSAQNPLNKTLLDLQGHPIIGIATCNPMFPSPRISFLMCSKNGSRIQQAEIILAISSVTGIVDLSVTPYHIYPPFLQEEACQSQKCQTHWQRRKRTSVVL